MKKVVVFIGERAVSDAVMSLVGTRSDTQLEVVADASQISDLGPAIVLTDLPDSNLDFFATLFDGAQAGVTSVVILTSQRNEHLAVQALCRGAMSYVPIRLMEVELLKTLDSVFSVLHDRDNRMRILDCMTNWRNEFVIENDSSLIAPLVRYFQESTERLGLLCHASEQTRMGIALEEALLNSMYHGNLEVPSALREEDDSKFYEVIECRRKQSPYQERRLVVNSSLSRDQAIFTIRDEGPGFDMSSIPDPTDPNYIERVSGRGMLLMRTFMDSVEYNEAGNVVTLSKRRQACDS